MGKIKDNAIVMRGGHVTERAIRDAGENKPATRSRPAQKRTLRIDTRDVVTEMSVQVWNDNTAKFTDAEVLRELQRPITHGGFALARTKDITRLGGTIRWQEMQGNPYHAVVDGLTVHQVVEVFSRSVFPQGLRGHPWGGAA
ncbi:MAG TPA: hypothetical protein VIL36_13905 [Acidimicrobiales bacterium]